MEKVCIMGMGGIGGYMAAHLLSAKNVDPGNNLSITCIARGKHLEVIKKDGLSFQKPGGNKNFFHPDIVTDSPSSLPEQDLIIFSVKGYDIETACKAISPITGPKTVIMPLLNGIDIYERVKKTLTTGIVLPSCIYIVSSIQSPGFVAHGGGKGNIISGADPLHKDFNPALLASLMAAAGIPFDWQTDPFPALWTKYLFIASYGLVTGLSGKSFGQILEDKELSEKVFSILKEIYSIASAKGIKLSESLIQESYDNARNFPYEATTSFARDLQVPDKANELDLFGGTIIKYGTELNIPTPATKEIYDAIKKKTASK